MKRVGAGELDGSEESESGLRGGAVDSGLGCGLRTENGGPRDRNWNSGRGAGGLEGIRASRAPTQEALDNSRGLHLLPQIQGGEKVELLLRDHGRASRFCGSPRAPLGLAHCRLALSPRPRRRLPSPEARPSPRLRSHRLPVPAARPAGHALHVLVPPPALGLGAGPRLTEAPPPRYPITGLPPRSPGPSITA